MQYSTNLGLPIVGSSDTVNWDYVNAIIAAVDAMAGALAPKFDSTSAYAQGDIVQHEGALYKAKGAVTAGDFDPTDWDALVVSQQLESTDLTNFVKYDATNGTGLTNGQLTKLAIQQ